MSERVIIRAFMAGLIDRAGGVDAAAMAISARLGSDLCKGTISKRMSGQLDWPLVDIMALEDAVGDPCVRRWLAARLPGIAAQRDLMQGVATLMREHGEAVSSVLEFTSGRASRDLAIKEVEDLRRAGDDLAARLRSGGGE